MVSGYEINMCFYAVSIAEGFREWILPKEDKLGSGASEYVEIIQELRQQTGYKFFFNHNELKKVKDNQFVDEDLERVLDAVLGKVNLSYRIEQGVIIIVPRGERGEKEVRIVGSGRMRRNITPG